MGYIPDSDIGFVKWANAFTKYVVAHYVELGVSAATKDKLVLLNNKLQSSYQSYLSLKAAFRGAKAEKNNTNKEVEAFMRGSCPKYYFLSRDN
ncbi:MAG: hypothetical protein HY769_02570 [Candidatus Stahlbacteria bacterium]|nr:hypothetical protein [Candidatus Stahlbacteria bacterium]